MSLKYGEPAQVLEIEPSIPTGVKSSKPTQRPLDAPTIPVQKLEKIRPTLPTLAVKRRPRNIIGKEYRSYKDE